MFVIETQRLGLRDWIDSDTFPFIEMNRNPEVMEFFPALVTEEESRAMITRIKNSIAENHFGFWAAEEKQSGSFMGFIGLSIPRFKTDFTPCVEIGWRMARPFWGRGYATEGARACLDYGLDDLQIPEILSFTSTHNLRSIRVMEKIGLKYIRQFEHPLIEEGSPLRTHVLYSTRLL